MELDCYLMNGTYDQVGTAGRLRLEEGRLSFTLDKAAGTRGAIKWIDKALGGGGVAARVEAGEQVTVFDTSVEGKKVKWPWNFRGRVFKVTDDSDRSWTVSLVSPGGGAMWFLNAGTGVEKEWKSALST
jgi:hypothetical protein